MTRIDTTVLVQSWVHSYEEDSADQAVYRPENFTFPTSRGRGGFDLKLDGTAIQFGPGPTDQTATLPGRWEVGEDGWLTLYLGGSDTPSRMMKITSLSPDKLILKKTDKGSSNH